MMKVTHHPEKVDTSEMKLPQWYADLLGGMINRSTKYEPEHDIFGFESDVAEELYGEKTEDMVEWYDKFSDMELS